MITKNHFNTPEYRQLEALYHQQKRREKLVKYLQSKWPNVQLEITETYFGQEISIIVDDIKASVVKIQMCKDISDVDIFHLIVAKLKKLKLQKRKVMMDQLLNVERYTE